MLLCKWTKDGGEESHVHGFYLIEIKSLFTIVLLRFSPGTREAFHSHAFNAISWVLKGELRETILNNVFSGMAQFTNIYKPSLTPIYTYRDTFHRVFSIGTTWAISFRGPWIDWWKEFIPKKGFLSLTHGRVSSEGCSCHVQI
jgi:hypothetical protein